MRIAKSAFAVLCLSLLIPPALAQNTATDDQSARQSADQFRTDYTQAVSKGDVDKLVTFFTDDAVVLPPMAPAITGKEAIRSDFARSFEKYNESVNIQSEEFKVLGEWAYDRGTSTHTLTPKSGGDARSMKGRYLALLHKDPDGSWKLSRLMINLDQPPPAGMRTE